jgi:hypothetical protein
MEDLRFVVRDGTTGEETKGWRSLRIVATCGEGQAWGFTMMVAIQMSAEREVSEGQWCEGPTRGVCR